tara:strand:- start:12478 stop:12999 length:522 start_codon:yes stop_codon:yes gene_type:complete
MKISTNKKELIKLNACEDGFKTFINAHGDNDVTLSQCLESNGWDDVWWLISGTYDQFSEEQKHDLRIFGCKKALINIEKIKPYCSDEDYNLIVNYLNNPMESARSAAWSAAWSAVESAAWSAARSAARSAAWSAVESAAWSAARSAAWSAARSAAMEENEYDLKQLFSKWENQ